MIKLSPKIFSNTLLAISLIFIIGCGGGGGDDDANNVENIIIEEEEIEEVVENKLAGTWLISKEDTSSYWIFNEDGTFDKKRAGESVNSANHFGGTYTITAGQISGRFTNPGVGTGEIEGTISADDTLVMDFIEYWHTPPKVVPVVGIRQ